MNKYSQQYSRAIAVAAMGILPAGTPIQHDQVALANETQFNEAYFNQPLTTYAVGWNDGRDLLGDLEFAAPSVLVPRRFTYAEFTNAEQFLSDSQIDISRSIGGDFKRVLDYTETKTSAETTNKGLTMRVDLDRVADKANWETMYTGKLINRLYRSEFVEAIALLSAAATNTAKTWDTTAGKDPDQDVLVDLVAGETASGVKNSRVFYGETAWVKRRLAHRAQTAAGGFASSPLTEDEAGSYLGTSVRVSRTRRQSTASAKVEIVNNLVLMFNAFPGMDSEDASSIKRFVSPVDGGGMLRVFTQQVSAKLYDITVEMNSLIKITSTLGIRKLTIS